MIEMLNNGSNASLLALIILLSVAVWFAVTGFRILAFANQRFEPVASDIQILNEAKTNQADLEVTYERLQSDYQTALGSIKPLEKVLHDADLGVGTTDQEFYASDNSTDDIDTLETKLRAVREEIKRKVSEKTACICSWDLNSVRVGNKKSDTTKFFNREIKLRLRCLDNEFKMAQAVVEWNNVNRLVDRCERAFDEINKRGDLVKTKLQKPYLDLKITELKLVHEIKQAKLRAKEELQAENARIREAEREEERIKKAAEKAKKDRELMEKLVQQELEKLDAASAEQVRQLETLKSQLAELKEKEQRAVSMAQITRAGYIYIITNEDSFGDAICKVGMTRRVNPLDRVKELGDASVPSSFDVQYLAYTEDAPKLERYLHSQLEDQRVNLVNRRKEFFMVDSTAVIDLLSKYDGEFEAVEVEEK